MHRVLILAVALALAWADNDDMKKCLKLFHPRAHLCCKWERPPLPKSHDPSIIKECLQMQGNPPSCERELCIATKHGLATSDGKIDKDGVQKMVDKNFSDNAELAKLIKDNCIEGDIAKYGEPDMCEPLKLKICMDFAFIASCPHWEDQGDCSGLEDLAKECVEKLT